MTHLVVLDTLEYRLSTRYFCVVIVRNIRVLQLFDITYIYRVQSVSIKKTVELILHVSEKRKLNEGILSTTLFRRTATTTTFQCL